MKSTMTASLGDSSRETGYYEYSSSTKSTPSASTSTNSDNMTVSPTETSLLEGLEGVNIQQFIGIADMRRAIKSRSRKLQAGDTNNQYLVFKPVTTDDLEKIDCERHTI